MPNWELSSVRQLCIFSCEDEVEEDEEEEEDAPSCLSREGMRQEMCVKVNNV